MSKMPPGVAKVLAHDWSVDDGAHGKEPYEPRGYDLPETEKMKHNEYIVMEYKLAKLWFDLFALCAPSGLEKLPYDLRWAKDLSGNNHLWLNDYWYNKLNPLEHWWLFAIFWSRAFSNKRSVDLPLFFDPITGFGDTSGQPFEKEGVTTCGGLLWVAENVSGAGTPVWCIDALSDNLPTAEKLLQYPFLVHAATISTTDNHNPTPLQNAPKGVWNVDPFGYFNGNVVPVPLFSIWTGQNAATREYDGIPLRANWFENTRILPVEDSSVVPNPYYPSRPLFPRG